MSNSNGENLEQTTPSVKEEGKTAQQIKRRRNRNRKKNAKVENLVSKTFQAKLMANSLLSESNRDKSNLDKTNIQKVGDIDNTKQELQVKPLPSNSSPEHVIEKKPPSPNNTNTTLEVNTTSKEITMNQQPAAEKTREEIKAEREAKKLAKQLAKKKGKDSQNPEAGISTTTFGNIETKVIPPTNNLPQTQNNEKDSKASTKEITNAPPIDKSLDKKLASINISASDTKPGERPKEAKPTLTKAERRAIQEAQRAAKAAAGAKTVPKSEAITKTTTEKKSLSVVPKENSSPRADKLQLKANKDCRVKLFNHLESCGKDSNLFANNLNIHPIIVRLGEQYAKRTIVGSNARCISFLSALKKVIQDYETPAKKEFARSLETTIKNCVDHLHKCRPLAVSVWNAYKHIKHVLTQLSVDQPESELKEHLCHFIDTYIENQIGKAAEAISRSVQNKILNGDVILTFGCSSLINYIFEEAHRRNVDFRVIVVDSRPFLEGQELLRRLTATGIPCTYVLINAVGFVMPEVTKILLGAHALLSNGYVMARAGTAQVALVARSFNVPVLVCCETHKFSERFQTDAIVYNELGNPDDLIMSNTCRLMNWQSQNKLSPLNLNYDITPPELVTAVVTEVAILPCTSVPVILRIKPTEIGY
ncbi:translation initiation factor eIF-2B subunit delta isoform X2 [Eupeodes corollae]|uniref:translation initiation factor eIF-2B subunit delta isoform X2 n=1 Tax=Eupeodes corollae TaxID=290404 RepID=UPI002491BC35|nr:translation initiation factor eIF-2B subunit delta isoform X2 [Eupeodes corollae]